MGSRMFSAVFERECYGCFDVTSSFGRKLARAVDFAVAVVGQPP